MWVVAALASASPARVSAPAASCDLAEGRRRSEKASKVREGRRRSEKAGRAEEGRARAWKVGEGGGEGARACARSFAINEAAASWPLISAISISACARAALASAAASRAAAHAGEIAYKMSDRQR